MNWRGWLNWKWLIWQAGAPLWVPSLISLIVVFFWWTAKPDFTIDWHIVLDLTPWVLTFYTTTLISATMADFSPKFSNHLVLGSSLLAAGFAVALYASLIVLLRHDPAFKPGGGVYFMTILLLLVSVGLCHRGVTVTNSG
jgi:hypothetical protein